MQGAGVLLLNTYASFRPKSILSHTNQLLHPPGSRSPPGNFNPLPTVLIDFSCPRVRCAFQLLWLGFSCQEPRLWAAKSPGHSDTSLS